MMLAAELISSSIPALKTTDSVHKSLERMAEFKLNHLPIVDKTQFLGLLAEEELLEVREADLHIGGLPLSIASPFVFEDTHVYDVIRLFNQLHITVVPVLDLKRNYLGLISSANILEFAADIFAVKEYGGIVVLEISNRNNSLAHMAQIVEADNAQILSSYVQSFPDSTRLEVTLKINRTDLSSIIASFERFNYNVTAVFNATPSIDGTMDRYDSLMNYLNI